MGSIDDIKKTLPIEIRLSEDKYNEGKKKFIEGLPYAVRSGKCSCEDPYCPHKSTISPLYMMLAGNYANDALEYNGNFSRDFKPSKYELRDIDCSQGEFDENFQLPLATMKLQKSGVFYARFDFSEKDTEKLFVSRQEINLEQVDNHDFTSIIIHPQRSIDIIEGFKFTGECVPKKIYIMVGGDKPMYFPNGFVNDFYIPISVLTHTYISFRFDFDYYDAEKFNYRIIAGNINFLNKEYLQRTNFFIPIERGRYLYVTGGMACEYIPKIKIN